MCGGLAGLAVAFLPSSALYGGVDCLTNEIFRLDNAMQMNPNGRNEDETAVHDCHCPGHMVVCMH